MALFYFFFSGTIKDFIHSFILYCFMAILTVCAFLLSSFGAWIRDMAFDHPVFLDMSGNV